MVENIPEGYKKTEVGVIPRDWKCIELGELISSMQLGGNYKNSEEITSYPLIKMGNLGRGKIQLTKIEYITNDKEPNYCDKLMYGDLLLNTRNTLELVGKVSIWRNELPLAYFNSNILRFKFNENYVSSTFFMNYLLNTKKSIEQLRNFATGTTSVSAIYTRDLIKLKVTLPSLKEQQAIANALSDIDNLIYVIEKLIKKKKHIMQGTMQELLTGKTRLDGFDQKWKDKKLGDIAEIIMGQSPDSLYYNDNRIGLPLVQGNADINNRKTIIRFYTSQITKTALKNDIIMTVRAPVGHIGKALFDCCIGRGVCAIKYENDFLYYYLIYIEDSWSKLSTGSTFDSVNSTEIKEIMVSLPPTIGEQLAIVKTLSDMNTEIENLNKKLNKYKQIKQGMMQELLTGKRRLI